MWKLRCVWNSSHELQSQGAQRSITLPVWTLEIFWGYIRGAHGSQHHTTCLQLPNNHFMKSRCMKENASHYLFGIQLEIFLRCTLKHHTTCLQLTNNYLMESRCRWKHQTESRNIFGEVRCMLKHQTTCLQFTNNYLMKSRCT